MNRSLARLALATLLAAASGLALADTAPSTPTDVKAAATQTTLKKTGSVKSEGANDLKGTQGAVKSEGANDLKGSQGMVKAEGTDDMHAAGH